MRGFHLPHGKFSLQYLKFSLRYTMGNMSGMFLFAFWVFSTQKCEVVIFPKFDSACMSARPLRYLDMAFSIIAHAPCKCMHDAHAQCDITRFTYDANHVTTMSPAFTFQSRHVGMRWHDIIGVCIA